MGSLEDAIPPVPLHFLSCGSAFFRDKNVIYWQKGAGSYGSLLHTICGALGLHFLGITKFIYAQCWESYPLMLHHLLNCRTAFFWDNKFHLQHNVSTMIFPASRPVAEMRVGCRSMFFHAQNADQWLPQQYINIFTPTHTIYSALKRAHPLLFQFGKHTCPWVIYPRVFAKPAPAKPAPVGCGCGFWSVCMRVVVENPRVAWHSLII